MSAWQGWRPVGGTATGTPGLAFDLDRGRLDLVAPEPGALRHYRLEGDTWRPIGVLQAPTNHTPALAVDADGALHLVVTAVDGRVLHSRHVADRWEGLADTGQKAIGAPALAYNTFARSVELVVVAPDGQLAHNRFLGGRWGTWAPVGATASSPPVIGTNFQDTAFDLIAAGPDGGLFHRRFAGSWGASTLLAATTTMRPALAVGPTGSLEVAITRPTGEVAHNRRVAGRWLGWQNLGFQSTLAPALVYNSDADALDLIAVSRDGAVSHNRFVNDAWTRWWPLGGSASVTPALVQGSGGDLELLLAGADGALWHNRFRPRAAGLVSFARDIQPLLDAHCTSCHEGPRPPMGLGLDATRAFGQTVNVASRELRRVRRVQPGDPEKSYLYLKLTGTHTAAGGSGTPMPPEATLSAAEIARIRDWIAQGALAN